MENVKVITPVGRLMWVNIAGVGKLKYNETGHDYVASVVLQSKEAKELIDVIKDLYNSRTVKGKVCKSIGYKVCNEDGTVNKELSHEQAEYFVFDFKTSTKYKDGTTKKIQVYNSQAAKVELGDTKIGNNSLGAISGSIGYYVNGKDDGISLYLNSIQIVKLIEYIANPGFDSVKVDDSFISVEKNDFIGKEDEVAKPRL